MFGGLKTTSGGLALISSMIMPGSSQTPMVRTSWPSFLSAPMTWASAAQVVGLQFLGEILIRRRCAGGVEQHQNFVSLFARAMIRNP